jgi:hypothetical protein
LVKAKFTKLDEHLYECKHETSVVKNKENEAPRIRGRSAKLANALEQEPYTLKKRVNKYRKTPLVGVSKSNTVKIRKEPMGFIDDVRL